MARAAAGSTVDSVGLIPVAFLVERARCGVFGGCVGVDKVAVLALLLAGLVGGPFTHATTSLVAEGFRSLERAGDTALSGGTVPHAAAVGVAAATIGVGGGAVVNASVVDEGASGVGTAVEFADAEVGDIVVAGARVAALTLSDVPLAFGLLVAISFVVVAVRALVDAASLVVLAHFDDSAGLVVLDLGALAGADGAVVIPLAAGVAGAGAVGCEAEGARAAAAWESLVAPGGLRLLEAASCLGAGILIGVQGIVTTGNALDDVDVAGGESVGVPGTFRPGAAGGGTGHALAGLDALAAGGRPHTVFVGARSLSVPAFRADSLALGSEGRPVTEGVDGGKFAFGLVRDGCALLVACRELLTPLTHGIAFAGRLVSELLAVFAAALSRDIPHAETVVVAVALRVVAVVATRLADGG